MDYDFQTKEELFASLHLITEHIDAGRLREGTKKLMKEKRESFTIMEELSIMKVVNDLRDLEQAIAELERVEED